MFLENYSMHDRVNTLGVHVRQFNIKANLYMVGKLGKLQSAYSDQCYDVKPYLTPCTSFVFAHKYLRKIKKTRMRSITVNACTNLNKCEQQERRKT